MNKLAHDITKEVLKDSTTKTPVQTPVVLISKQASQVDIPGRWNAMP